MTLVERLIRTHTLVPFLTTQRTLLILPDHRINGTRPITFTHYLPQQHGFSSVHALHAQAMIPAGAATAATYTQPHYSPSKPAQYTAALQASTKVPMSSSAQT